MATHGCDEMVDAHIRYANNSSYNLNITLDVNNRYVGLGECGTILNVNKGEDVTCEVRQFNEYPKPNEFVSRITFTEVAAGRSLTIIEDQFESVFYIAREI